MTFEQLLAGSLPVSGIAYDSRRVLPGYVFFAFPGAKADGRRFALAAVERGAIAVVSESESLEQFPVPWIQVPHGRRALATLARSFYHAPDEVLGITGVTGTNGKTTTTFLLDGILRHVGKVTALIGTIEYRMAGKILPAVNTTPESLDLFRMFRELADSGGTHVTMEVSSHALALGRVHGVRFHTAVFTNLTRDHLDFHRTMEEYFAAKSLLFEEPLWSVINFDDPYGSRLHPPGRVLRYGFGEGSDLRARDMRMGFDGLHFAIEYEGQRVELASPLAGRINVYNILAATGAALSYGLSWEEIVQGVLSVKAVPGRFERIDAGQPFLVVVDYAHTDDALRNVISVARGLGPKRVITLFGCGGDRDKTKRPLMGRAAAEASDLVVLTSDNPRSEDPLAIIEDARVGFSGLATPCVIEQDRAAAIRVALAEAREGDIVILAGKGHEPYQELKSGKIDFDDREVARRNLEELGYTKR